LVEKRHVVIFDGQQFANGVRRFVCTLNREGAIETIPKIRMSDPFDQVIIGLFFSPKISDKLAKRFSLTFNHWIQGGFLVREEGYTSLKDTYCILMQNHYETQDRTDMFLPFYIFQEIFVLYVGSLVILVICFIFEYYTA